VAVAKEDRVEVTGAEVVVILTEAEAEVATTIPVEMSM